jgi:acyl-CoA thioester hydrolase
MKDFGEITVRVRYAETDQLGVVYHANYFVWFEVGRVELMRELGIVYKQLEVADDCHIVVTEARCRYERPAKYDDLLRVRTRIAEVHTRTMSFGYEVIRDENGESVLLTTGSTKHVVCGRDGRPKTLPEKYRKVLSQIPAVDAAYSRR